MNNINLNKKLCPLCEAEANENNIVDIVENIWENNKNVYECSNCKLYFIDEPSQSEIEFLYNSDFYARNNNIIYKFIDAKMKYARALNRFNYIKKFIKKTDNLNVLEIGASDGLLLSIFKKENFNVFGYELNENARKNALKKYDIKMKDDFLKDKNIDKNKYNIVIMSHILEHFTNPKYILNSVHNFIEGDDILFIEIPYTPNYKIVSKDEMKIFFETEHTVHFNEKNISLLMKECNFKILDICYNEYNINDNNLKKNIWLGKFDFKSSINFLYFISQICFNPKNAFIDYKISDNFNFGRNIRIIAAKNN